MELPNAGDQFDGRYRVQTVLGEGAFGAVYLADDEHGRRSVALKVLKPDQGRRYAASTRARFEREGRIVGSLQSPHTVRLHDVGVSDDGLLYMVFEWVRGEDLSVLLERRGTLQREEALHVLWQVADSLREAHDAGLLHRDLKPHNIRLFSYAGDPLTVKVLDFGLARGTDDGHPAITATGELVGTPRYMSPEQLLDRPLTPASDVYCLGLVAIEMLLGRGALASSTWGAQLDRLRPEHQFDLSGLEPSDRALARLLHRMTAFAPEDRLSNGAAVLAELTRLEHPNGPDDARAALSGYSEPRDRGRRAILFGGVLVLVAVVVVAVLVGREVSEEEATGPRVPARRVLTPPAYESAAPEPQAPAREAETVSGTHGATSDSGGCGQDAPFVGDGQLSEKTALGGWLTHVPRGYDFDRRHPVLLYLHPIGRSAAAAVRYAKLAELSDEEGVILIAPDDGAYPWQDPYGADLERLLDALETTSDRLCVDREQVYALGHGAGGHVADALACTDSVAAVATYGYRPDRGFRFCLDAAPKPMLLFIAKKSKHNPFEGGRSCTAVPRLSAAEFEKMWQTRNECGSRKTETARHGGSVCWAWSSCAADLEVCHLDGGHRWPGAPPRPKMFDMLNCDGPSTDFPMIADHLWRFLSTHTRNGDPGQPTE